MTTPASTRPEDPARPRLPTALVTWAFIGSILMLVVALVIVRLTEGTSTAGAASRGGHVPASVLAAISRLPAAAFDQAVTGTLGTPAPEVLSGQTPLAVGRQPEVVFVGAEFSPYSAAASWALVAALDRFGSFSGLTSDSSSNDEVFGGTPGFSFNGATYYSKYVTLVAVERYGSTPATVAPAGFPQAGSPSPAVDALLRRFDGRTGTGTVLPFVDVGNRLTVVGADFGFSPGLLQRMSMGQIAADLSFPARPVTDAVLGAADQLSAAICGADGEDPATVCASAGVRDAAGQLGIG